MLKFLEGLLYTIISFITSMMEKIKVLPLKWIFGGLIALLVFKDGKGFKIKLGKLLNVQI